ncbi:MAG: VCBS repeat-containing protein, partial [Bacteroidota bacterium]|nr:VCBS repeat-containing protein [Bacteroidota bacterium]MDX5431072.1 VCBS repeat-containing protein [Bacteroidota bacterium]MDX5469826.1 VCBS repeat-containing protein [Bacteroidota bacterium]
MKKFLTCLSFAFLMNSSFAQKEILYLSNGLRFLDEQNDTILEPFIGGFVAPQFSEIDLNNDGVKDLFVFDRSGNKVLTFINEGKAGQVSYVHAPKYEFAFPALRNWVLLRDYNCDGKEDIFSGSIQHGVTVYKNVSLGDSLMFEL